MKASKSEAAEAIVVLGCGLRGESASPALRRRLECGLTLFAAGRAPLLLLSGGSSGGRPEAAVMRDIAAAAGVPGAVILIEAGSRNTYENAAGSARLLAPRGAARLVLVSDAYHLPRARFLFAAAGLRIVATAHPPRRGFAAETRLALREALAWPLSLYRIWRRSPAPQ